MPTPGKFSSGAVLLSPKCLSRRSRRRLTAAHSTVMEIGRQWSCWHEGWPVRWSFAGQGQAGIIVAKEAIFRP